MKKNVFVTIGIIAAIGLTGCGSAPTQVTTTQQETTTAAIDPIIGMWKHYKTLVNGEKDPNDSFLDFEIYYTFYEDGTFAGVDNNNPATGTWKKASPDSYVITSDDRDKIFTLKDNELSFDLDFSMGDDELIATLVMQKQ